MHWEGSHSASRPQSQQLRTIPLLAEFVVNRHYKPLGTGSAPVPPLQWPLGSLPHTSKDALLVQVEGLLCKPEKAPTPAPISQVVPPCMKAVCEVDRRMVVQTAAIATPPDVVPPTPVLKAPVQVDSAQQVSSGPDSPNMIASSPSFQHSFSSKSASPISPAFTVLSTPSLAFRMSSSRSLLGSPILPPVTSLTSDMDPEFAQRSPLLQERPTPTRPCWMSSCHQPLQPPCLHPWRYRSFPPPFLLLQPNLLPSPKPHRQIGTPLSPASRTLMGEGLVWRWSE